LFRRAGGVTDGEAYVGQALLKRLGQDGRCDPLHQTLADDSGESVSTVKRALKAFWACGLVSWARRLWRIGTRVSQDTNAYLLTLGEAPKFPRDRCEAQSGRQTLRKGFKPVAKGPTEGSDEWARWNRDRQLKLLKSAIAA
jgi:hypothetical protein